MPDLITIDCREMESPEPMVKVLEAVALLKGNQKICMVHRKKPFPLFERLEEKGMTYDCEDLGTHFNILIWKANL